MSKSTSTGQPPSKPNPKEDVVVHELPFGCKQFRMLHGSKISGFFIIFVSPPPPPKKCSFAGMVRSALGSRDTFTSSCTCFYFDFRGLRVIGTMAL